MLSRLWNEVQSPLQMACECLARRPPNGPPKPPPCRGKGRQGDVPSPHEKASRSRLGEKAIYSGVFVHMRIRAMLSKTKISKGFQTVIPSAVRETFDVEAGDYVEWMEGREGLAGR